MRSSQRNVRGEHNNPKSRGRNESGGAPRRTARQKREHRARGRRRRGRKSPREKREEKRWKVGCILSAICGRRHVGRTDGERRRITSPRRDAFDRAGEERRAGGARGEEWGAERPRRGRPRGGERQGQRAVDEIVGRPRMKAAWAKRGAGRERDRRETGESLGQVKNKSASRQDGRRLNDSQGYGTGAGGRSGGGGGGRRQAAANRRCHGVYVCQPDSL